MFVFFNTFKQAAFKLKELILSSPIKVFFSWQNLNKFVLKKLS